MSLSEKAILVSFTASVWSARRLDRAASKEVADNHHSTVTRAGNFNKMLIDVKAPSYTGVVKAVTEARTYYYSHTLPWTAGSGILLASGWLEFSKEIRKLRTAFDVAVNEFIDDYPRLKGNAKHELNGLYREEDYPTVDALRDKFFCGISVLPVPDAGDFRVTLDSEERERLQAHVQEQVEKAQQGAMRDLWERLHSAVSHAAQTLSAKDKTFRDSLVGNLQEITQILPRLNIAGDEHLNALSEEVSKTLASYDPVDLREKPRVRAKAAATAADITKRMSALMEKR